MRQVTCASCRRWRVTSSILIVHVCACWMFCVVRSPSACEDGAGTCARRSAISGASPPVEIPDAVPGPRAPRWFQDPQ